MKTQAIIALFVLQLFLTSCDKRKVVSVVRIGELENVIHDGDMSAHAQLGDFKNQPDLYALGTVTNNKGFVTILGGKSYTSYIDSVKGVMIDSSFNASATLLLYANVSKWKPYQIPNDVTTWKQLEQYISNQAVKYDVSRNKSFPFLLKGIADTLSWHVLDWRPGIKEITYKKMLSLGQTGKLINESIEAIGFYSKDQKEIFVHQETVLNIHFVNHDHSLAGRIDDLALSGRMVLYLPTDDD